MDQGFGDTTFGHAHSSPSSVPGYIPGYLLGGSTQSSSPMTRNWSTPSSHHGSPASRSHLSSASKGMGSIGASPQKQLILTDKLHVQQTSIRGTPTMGRTPKDSIGAPPVEGLYDARHASPAPVMMSQQTQWNMDRNQMDTSGICSPGSRMTHFTPGPSTPIQESRQDTSVFSPRSMTSPPSPAQIDPFYTQGENLSSDDVLNQCWVTVFGFPPAATSFILQQFAQYGNIVRHEVMTNKNWMHVQYQSKLQAKKALSKNGKVYSSNIMVGVMPCIEKSVMEGAGKENTFSAAETMSMDVSMKTATPSRLPIRPLTAAYQAASSNHQVIPQDGRTPQKNSNVISKAMEYMFGW